MPSAIGFSTCMCLPAAASSSTAASRTLLGVQTAATSKSAPAPGFPGVGWCAAGARPPAARRRAAAGGAPRRKTEGAPRHEVLDAREGGQVVGVLDPRPPLGHGVDGRHHVDTLRLVGIAAE